DEQSHRRSLSARPMKLVIPDRDGTINHDSDHYIKSLDEWRPIKGSLEAIARLTQAGYRIVVATNQAGIARGLFSTRTLFDIHDAMQRSALQAGGRIDAFFFCPHAAAAGCQCRKPHPWLRAGPFALAPLPVTPPSALIALATFPLPRMWRYRIISGWSRLNVWLARALLGIDWRVEGREHLPDRPAVILAKHQSAWETMAFQLIFPPQVLVLKRELLWIPFFGWGLALMSPIAIDRSRGMTALRAIARRGRERLAQGFWVVIFPE